MNVETKTISPAHTPVATRRKLLAKLTPYLWLLPSLILIFVVVLYPIYELFVTSFSDIGRSGLRKGFTGFSNYQALFEDGTFLLVLKNTLVWTLAVVGISTLLSLAIASLLDQEFWGRRFVRAALIVPWATSLVITSVIWKWIFDYNYGALNLTLSRFGLISKNVYWLADASLSFPALIYVGIMVTIPFSSFVLLAGLQSISASLYEAAKIDGASSWQSFSHITLPLLKPALTVSTVLNTIYVFNSFPIIWSITRGDPLNQTDTVVTYLYKLAFQAFQVGEAAAVSAISFLILLAFAVLYGILTLGERTGRG